jgi:hypothetical protein
VCVCGSRFPATQESGASGSFNTMSESSHTEGAGMRMVKLDVVKGTSHVLTEAAFCVYVWKNHQYFLHQNLHVDPRTREL